MIAGTYRLLTSAAAPVLRLSLARRARRGKERHERLAERRGISDRPRPAGPLIWVHAASLGESASMLAVIDRVLALHPHANVLMTSGTVTAADFLGRRLPPRALHQFVPLDVPRWVRRFLDHWRPDLALWAESELWPNLIEATQQRGVPMALLNGRMSERSFERWRRVAGLMRPLLARFALVLAQDGTQCARFAALGGADVRSLGNLKYAAPPPPVDAAELDRLRAAIGARPLWLAASTHPGEEEQVAAAHRRIAARFPDLLTILVPRHAERGAAVRGALDRLAMAQRSRGEPPTAASEVYLADTMGELGLFYELARIVFLGGSLVEIGGHNPVEPAQFGCALLSGPAVTNFTEVYARFRDAGAAKMVADAEALAAAVAGHLVDPRACRRAGEAAAAVAAAEAGVLDRAMAALAPLLEPLAARTDAHP